MLELGKESGNLHKQIGAMVPEMNFDMLLAVGKEAKKYVEGAKARGMKKVFHFNSVADVGLLLPKIRAMYALSSWMIRKENMWVVLPLARFSAALWKVFITIRLSPRSLTT